ncbi:hypothetical protein ACQI5H_07390 [Mycobacterium heidelbergense]|uniref:hypothetical protein n=1 Tax=Mycobacterium heidelbergense TaxID=53376 RepID=UPI003CE86A24
MNTTARSSVMTRAVVGLAATLLVSGAVCVAGLSAGTAHAQPGATPLAQWCPGQPIPGPHGQAGIIGDWDMNACHEWHFAWHDFPPGPNGMIEQGPMPHDPSCPPWATIFSGPAQCGGL